MNRASVNLLILLLLAIVTGVTLALHLPGETALNRYAGQALAYGVLTAFTLYFGMLLSEGELSPAHMVGLVALLSLPPDAQPVMTWAIFLGGVAGGALLIFRQHERLLRRPVIARTARSVVAVSARVTLSFLVAGQFYRAAGGVLPLSNLLGAGIPALLLCAVLYILVYLAIFLLEMYLVGYSVQRILRENPVELFALLVLPVPFGLATALLVADVPTALAIFIAGAAAFALALYGLSRAQHQLRQQINESRSLAVVGQALQSDLNLDSLLQTIYNQVARLLNVDHFLVALYDGDRQRLDFPLAVRGGQPYRPAEDAAKNTLLQHVLWTQKPLLISRDVNREATRLGLLPPGEPVYSWMGVPLLVGGRLLGAMVVMSDDPKHLLKPDDLRLLSIIGAGAGASIDNAQLYRQQITRAEQLAVLNRVLALLTVTLSPEAVLDAVVSSASLISGATGVAVFLAEQESLKLAGSAGLSDAFTADPPGLLLTDFRQPPVLVADVSADARASASRERLRRENKAAWIEMPLLVGDTGLGVLVLYFDTPQTFGETGVEIIRAFVNQAAQAIRNARQYSKTGQALERRAEQMYALATLGRQLTAPMSPPEIGALVLARALELTRAHAGLIVLKDEHSGEPVVLAGSGYPAVFTASALQHSIAGQALRSGHVLTVPDARRAALPPLLETARSQLAAPIVRDSQPQGVIVLESRQEDAFGDEDQHFAMQLANHTTIAIYNSRLFARVSEARDRLQVILNAMTEALVLVDRAGVIALANPRVDLIGLAPEQLAGRKIEDLLADPELNLAARMGFESAKQVLGLVGGLQARSDWVGLESAAYTVENDQGAVYIQRDVMPISSADGAPLGILMVFYNLTEEHELAQMREDLSRMIVHDLRSPLTAVTTGLKLLREVVPANNAYRSIIESTTETSQRAIRKLLSRVDSLLDISRMESGQLTLEAEPTELATLVDSVCVELSPLAHELEVALNSEVGADIPLVNVDRDKIERVLQNLVDNALKYSPADTAITIRAYQPGLAGAPAGFLRVDVADQGPGVPDEYKSRLFDRFVQVKGRRGARRGIGLGLTFCKMAVEAHGGRIWVENNPGGGSLFAFTVPVETAVRLDETGEWPVTTSP
ncbi:MAG: GAF domain-containing protein [Chloroflexi bacterium]|nr:GAF domain-containing protein [Chloroflexota bacterium]MDL1884652.1 GAF domain-containing protein [Anaerolineae bacterium CFX8]